MEKKKHPAYNPEIEPVKDAALCNTLCDSETEDQIMDAFYKDCEKANAIKLSQKAPRQPKGMGE